MKIFIYIYNKAPTLAPKTVERLKDAYLELFCDGDAILHREKLPCGISLVYS